MRDGLNHRWAGKHADASADSHAAPHADARTVSRSITIKRAHAITVRATQPESEPDS